MDNETTTIDGEIISSENAPAIANQSLAVSLAKAEIDQQIMTSRALPRSIQKAVSNITTLATLDEETAEECIYAVPRGGKTIRGPSIRFAEIVASQWGNCRIGARVVHVDKTEKYVEAEGVFHDLETNVAHTARVRRTIQAKRGKGIDNDMIQLAGAAACSIARRNAILAGIPKGVARQGYLAVEKVIRGDIKTLAERRDRALEAFAQFGVSAEQIFEALGIGGKNDITLDHLTTLTGMRSAIKNGESTVEEMFGKPEPAHKVVKNPLADEPAQETGAQASQAAAEEAESARSSDLRDTAAADIETAEVGNAFSAQAAAQEAAADPVFAAGVEAAMKGASRKAVPATIKSDEEKAARWLSGFDSVRGK
jgi:hypothetical protein